MEMDEPVELGLPSGEGTAARGAAAPAVFFSEAIFSISIPQVSRS